MDTVVQLGAEDSTCQNGFQADQEKEGSEEECKAGGYFSSQGSHFRVKWKYFYSLLFTQERDLDDSEKIKIEQLEDIFRIYKESINVF